MSFGRLRFILTLVVVLVLSSCMSKPGPIGADAVGDGPAPSAAGEETPPGGDSTEGSSLAATDDVSTDWVLPLDAAVEDLTGYSEDAVVTAVNDARFDFIVTCMTGQGWEFDLSDLPSAAMTEEEKSTRTVTGKAAYYLTVLDDARVDGEPGGTVEEDPSDDRGTDPEFQQDEYECWMQAEDEFPNPIDSLSQWLAEALDDLNEEVGQDERYVAAQQDALACIAAEGYDFRTSAEGFNHYFDLADAVWNRYQSGDIDEDTVRSELRDLAVEEKEFAEIEWRCSKEAGRIGYLVRSEYEEQFVTENGDRIALAAAEYREKLEPFREFLIARKNG